MSTKALEIWKKLSQWNICLDAVNFFENKNLERDKILEKGSVDFDNPNNLQEDEKRLYRAAYYCSTKGSMEMHIKQNQIALNNYLQKSDLMKEKILFVDFGCGPMTAGLVFAEILNGHGIKCKDNIQYLGIDASNNMCEIAKKVNNQYKIFESSMILNSDSLDISQVSFSPDISVLCFSYILAPDTLQNGTKEDISKSLAKNWHGVFKKSKFCSKTIAIYQNPKDIYQNPNNNYEMNWRAFVKKLHHLGKSDDIEYTPVDIEDCNWGGQRASAMAMITGER